MTPGGHSDMDIEAQDGLEEWLDAGDELTEDEMRNLALQASARDISLLIEDLAHIQDRWKYYAEPPVREQIDALKKQLERIRRDLGGD